MRVVAGQFRGRSLEAPPGRVARPFTDRAKESLFNILGHLFATPGRLPAFSVLDVFSGPGSLGIEALSRGAAAGTFVERDRQTLASLRRNIDKLGLGKRATILTDNAWTMRPPPVPNGFGLMFVDPPYRDARNPTRVIDLLNRLTPAVADDGVLVFRHEASATPPPEAELSSLRIVDERGFARMRVMLLRRGPLP